MSRLSLFNIGVGFLVLTLAACAGVFIVYDLTKGFVHDQQLLNSWMLTIQRSSHGHTNLFGILQILFGLTLPYSVFSFKIKFLQTVGLSLGTLAMGPGMLIESYLEPTTEINLMGVVLGILLASAVLTLFSHACGVGMKFKN